MRCEVDYVDWLRLKKLRLNGAVVAVNLPGPLLRNTVAL